MTFMTFVNCDLFNAYACRCPTRCFYELSIFENQTFAWAIGASLFGQLLVVYFPPLQKVFQTESLRLIDLLYILMLSSTVLLLDTIRKKFFIHYFSDSSLISMKVLEKKYSIHGHSNDLIFHQNTSNNRDADDLRKGTSSTMRSRSGKDVFDIEKVYQ